MRSWDCETGVLSSFGQVGAGLVLWHLFSDCFVKENRILPAYVHLLKQRTVRPFAPKLFETLPMVLHSRLKDRSAIFHLPKTGWAHQCTQQPLSFT